MFIVALYTIAKTWNQPHQQTKPISDELDKENVAHIHHGIVCSHMKGWVRVLCRDMDKAGNHHSQQTNTGTENQTLHMFSLISGYWTMRTPKHREGNITHWGLSGVGGASRRIALGEISNVNGRLMGAANHHGKYILISQTCTFYTCIPQLKV